jgi:hypothetical protein
MSILQTLVKLNVNPTTARLGAGQQPRRQLEQMVRQRAVHCAGGLLKRGYSHAEAARRLTLKERTLRSWNRTLGRGESLPRLGRPLAQSDAAQQQAVFFWLERTGPGVGVQPLRARFEGLARAELDELLKDYRRRWRQDNLRLVHVLDWQRPGTVWAMDFAEAPCAIDGLYPYLLAVRDLGSGQQLLWQPVAASTVQAVLAELPGLFALYGAPLVLKTDNGSAFIADKLRWYLSGCGVGQLFSPPQMPAYNGAIEASIGSLKRRTEHQCQRAGHPGLWTSAAVQAARVQANTSTRPRRLHGLTPHQVWEARRPVGGEERNAFRATATKIRNEERARRKLTSEDLVRRAERAAIDRLALRRALVAHDLLLFRRRRIPPQITRPQTAMKA